VILRVIRGRGTGEQVAGLRAAIDSGSADRAGLERFHVGSRPAGRRAGEGSAPKGTQDVVVISHWGSADAAARADANGTSPLAVAGHHLDAVQAVHFEVDESIRRQSDDRPVAIRIATGTFSRPGTDSEMQNMLRERTPLIDDAMAEAWVGRRLTGRAVEVTFVSAWRRIPGDRALDQAFWPDIALRYDQFVVEVYDAVGVE
jgi:hypothetical protein